MEKNRRGHGDGVSIKLGVLSGEEKSRDLSLMISLSLDKKEQLITSKLESVRESVESSFA